MTSLNHSFVGVSKDKASTAGRDSINTLLRCAARHDVSPILRRGLFDNVGDGILAVGRFLRLAQASSPA